MSFLDDVQAALVAGGVDTNIIFLSSKSILPGSEGPFLSIIETGGSGAERTHNGSSVERPGAQLLARAKDVVVARGLLLTAYNLLGGANGLHNVQLGGGTTWYLSLTFRQQITDIGLDAHGRAMVSINIDAEKQPS